MKSRHSVALLLVSFLLPAHAEESTPPATPIELNDFQEVAGILAWSFRLPEDVGAEEYARLEWNILPDVGAGRVEPAGISFPELKSSGEIKIFLWVDDIIPGNKEGVRSISYCVKTRAINGKWEKRKGVLQLPEGFSELYGFEKSGPSDLDGFVMLNSSKYGKGLAHLNLGYAPRK